MHKWKIGDRCEITNRVSAYYGQEGVIESFSPTGIPCVRHKDGKLVYHPWGYDIIRGAAKPPETKRNLFQLGDFVLHSGEESFFKIDADALTLEDWQTLALMLLPRLPEFGSVEGVPRGGIVLASFMLPHVTEGPLLICDDVVTSGGSLEAHRAGREAIGAVVFARRKVTLPWVTALFTLSEEINHG